MGIASNVLMAFFALMIVVFWTQSFWLEVPALSYDYVWTMTASFLGLLLWAQWRKFSLKEVGHSFEALSMEQKYSWLAENMDDVIWVQDASNRMIYISPSVEKLRGFSAHEVMRQSFDERICESSRDLFKQALFMVRHNEASESVLKHLRIEQPCKDGTTVWTEVNARLVFDQSLQKDLLVGVSRNVTQNVENERELKRTKAMFETLFYGASDPILLLEDGRFSACNDAILQLLRLDSRESVLGKSPVDFSPEYQPDGEKSAQKAQLMMQICLRKGQHRFQWVHTKADGREFWSEISLTRVCIEDKQIIHVIWRDISEFKNLEQALQTQVKTDNLTGLLNRRQLDAVLNEQKQLADSLHQPFGLLLIDVDFFKRINDDYGHAEGDRILIEMSNVLKQNLRTSDFIGRWGGEEFMVVMPSCSQSHLVEQAETLRQAVLSYDFDLPSPITISLGSSLYRLHEPAKLAFIRADKGLYYSKERGRNQACFVRTP